MGVYVVNRTKKNWFLREIPFHLMVLPAVILVFIYSYIPMTGLMMAFEDFKSGRGFMGFFTSPFVGLKHFEYLFGLDRKSVV